MPAVLLDLDGTLLDPFTGISRSMTHALAALGLPPLDDAVQRRMIGPPLQDVFASLGLDPAQVDRAVDAYRERFSTVGLYENVVYDGVPELLDGLRTDGVRLALATSKPEVYALRILEHFGLAEGFETVCGASLDGVRRAKADVVAEALRRLGHPGSATTVMVGDRRHDVEGAAAHGLDCVAVAWGYAEPGELASAGVAHVVTTPAELLALLRRRHGSSPP